jgi:hypothetical protein
VNLASALLFSLPGQIARAEHAAAYDLDYAADAECPDRATFERLVRAQLVESHEAARVHAHARVLLRREAERVVARLELDRDDGSGYVRDLTADSCSAAAPAIAFVLAYALGAADAEARALPAKSPALGLARIPSPAARRSIPERVASRSQLAALRQAPRERRWRVALGASLGARTGLGPIWTLVESGSAELRSEAEGSWAPTVRVSLAQGVPITRIDRFGSTFFTWRAGRLDACPIQLSLGQSLRARPCLGMHLGRLDAVGAPAALSGSAGRHADELWLDWVGALRLQLPIVPALTLDAQGDLIVPLTPYSFAFDHPDTLVYRIPSLAFAGFVGLAAHFP